MKDNHNHANEVARRFALANSIEARGDRERTAGLSDAELEATGRRRCGRCGVPKPLGEFHRDGRRLQSYCRACKRAANAIRDADPEVRRRRAERRRELRAADPEKREREREYVRRYNRTHAAERKAARQTLLGRLREQLYSARRRRKAQDARIAALEAEIARLVARRDASMGRAG